MAERFTKAKVETVSNHAKKLTGDRFGLSGIGGDLGNGVRYIDGRKQQVWFGSRGARQAASYYLGVIDAYNPGEIGDLPGDVKAVRRLLLEPGGGWVQAQYDQGADDANGAKRWQR